MTARKSPARKAAEKKSPAQDGPRDELGRFSGQQPAANLFQKGYDPRRNAGGVPKGARLSSAVLRRLARELGIDVKTGMTRTEADEVAKNIVEIAKKGGIKSSPAAVAAFRAMADLTEGMKVRVEDETLGNLAGASLDEILELRATLTRGGPGAAPQGQPRRRRSRG